MEIKNLLKIESLDKKMTLLVEAPGDASAVYYFADAVKNEMLNRIRESEKVKEQEPSESTTPEVNSEEKENTDSSRCQSPVGEGIAP